MGGRSSFALVLLGLLACSRFEYGEAAPPDAGVGDAGGPATPDAASTDAGAATYRDVVLADRPLAYWSVGRSIGATVSDLSGHGFDLTIVGNRFPGDGPFAGSFALQLDGVTTYGRADVPDFAARSPFTFEMWMRPAIIDGAFRHLYGKDSYPVGGREEYGAYIHADQGGDLAFERHVAGVNETVHAKTTTLTYSHVVTTYDGATLALFVDGVPVVQASDSRTQLPKSGPTFIGARSADGLAVFKGALAEIAIYDSALSPDRIAIHHDVGSKK